MKTKIRLKNQKIDMPSKVASEKRKISKNGKQNC